MPQSAKVSFTNAQMNCIQRFCLHQKEHGGGIETNPKNGRPKRENDNKN